MGAEHDSSAPWNEPRQFEFVPISECCEAIAVATADRTKTGVPYTFYTCDKCGQECDLVESESQYYNRISK